MKRNNRYFICWVVVSSIFYCLALMPAYAHYPWITPHDNDGSGNEQLFEFAWGHHFPTDGILSADRIDSIVIIAKDGTTETVSPHEATLYAAGPEAHIIAATQKSGYYSRTTKGGRQGSKVDYPDALSCGLSTNTMKALVGTGGIAGGQVLGHPLEIVPISDASNLKKGEAFSVKVLFHGKPFTGNLRATWEGFSGEEALPFDKQLDSDGVIDIPLEEKGLWMIIANTSEDYPDPDVCDNLNYTSTLTFRVK